MEALSVRAPVAERAPRACAASAPQKTKALRVGARVLLIVLQSSRTQPPAGLKDLQTTLAQVQLAPDLRPSAPEGRGPRPP